VTANSRTAHFLITYIILIDFVNCGTVAYENTIDTIMRCRPSADIHERNYRYCNYIIEEIDHARKSLLDVPLTLIETKRILEDVKKHY